MNTYLIFRTDRIGDFLLSAIMINSIKRNDPNSHITVVSSKKNHDYIKSFNFINEVILLENSLFNKIKVICKLRSKYYDFIIVHDLKNRSSIISLLLKYKFRIKPNKNLDISYIDSIKKILLQLDFNFLIPDLNILNGRDFDYTNLLNDDYIVIHFDEKWIYKDYISEYTNIEPSQNDFISFINLLLSTSNKKIVITTGIDCPKILDNLFENNFNQRIKIFKKISFIDLEVIISKCELLISCHGSVSHIATAHNIKQIDIIEENKSNFYLNWTKHFRNYFPLYRKKFSDLSNEIINLL